jgi:hypothetical protein
MSVHPHITQGTIHDNTLLKDIQPVDMHIFGSPWRGLGTTYREALLRLNRMQETDQHLRKLAGEYWYGYQKAVEMHSNVWENTARGGFQDRTICEIRMLIGSTYGECAGWLDGLLELADEYCGCQ